MKKLLLILAVSILAVKAQAQTLTVTLSNYVPKAPWNVQCTATVTKSCVSGWRVINTTGGTRTTLFDVPANATVTGGTASGTITTWNGTVVVDTVGKNSSGVEVLSIDSIPFGFGPPSPDPPAGTVVITITVQ